MLSSNDDVYINYCFVLKEGIQNFSFLHLPSKQSKKKNKIMLQVNKEKYKSLGNGFKVTIAEGGASGLFLGWAPTAIGYSAQGLCKFGFYEVFKKIYSDMIGEENTFLYRTSLYLAASASAEFFADIALSPMESCKVQQYINLL